MDIDTSGAKPECLNCGARLPAGTTRCPVCGTWANTEPQQRRCPNCGTPAAQQAQDCLMCGAPLEEVALGESLASVSWPWVAAVALIVALVGAGWSYWTNQNESAAAVPTATPRVTSTPTHLLAAAVATVTATGTPSPVPTPTPIVHEIQAGETVYYIASYYGTSPEAILEANGLDENSARFLRVGQKLVIPSTGAVGGPISGSAPQAPRVIHEVASGETLITIANEYGTTVEAILGANNLDSPDLIYVGQNLIVPLMPPTATPTLTATATPSSTPGPPYPAPDLLSPPNSIIFQDTDAIIVLSWTSIGILRENQAYLVELETPAHTDPITYTTQATAWRLPPDLKPTGRRRGLSWRVTVVQHLASDPDVSTWEPISLPSETRHFVWQ
jgi:LysM repeat protein